MNDLKGFNMLITKSQSTQSKVFFSLQKRVVFRLTP